MLARPAPVALLTAAPEAAPSGAAHFLIGTVRGLLRQPDGWVALVLRLSLMTPPAPRTHHRRVARVLLQDAAQRHDGQVLVMRNGDLVLLSRAPRRAMPELAEMLGRLLRVDAPDPARLLHIWPLTQFGDALMAYAEERAQEPMTCPDDEDLAAQTSTAAAIGTLVDSMDVLELLQRQTAILVMRPDPTRGSESPQPGGMALPPIAPLFRELTFSIAALEARLAGAQGGDGKAYPSATADPYLFRHLAGRLDRRMLELLPAQVGSNGPLDPAPGAEGTGETAPLLHLNLTLAGIDSPGFQALIAARRSQPGPIAPLSVEVSLLEACAEPAAYARARAILAAAQCRLVLDQVSHMAMMLTRPWLMGAELLKLEWSPRAAELGEVEAGRLAAAIAQAGPQAIVLCRAETEAALRWGMARGIRRFQGRHVDAMLGAARIIGCPEAEGCTLRQCIDRAAAATPAGRRFCRNLPLLEAGAPRRPGLTAGPRRPVVTG